MRVKETSHCTSTIYDLTTLFFNFIFFFRRHSGESRSNREKGEEIKAGLRQTEADVACSCKLANV